jgi:putative ABC transport system permease protein
MPLNEFREIFGIPERVDYIMVQVDEGEDVLEVASRTEERLRKSRGQTEKTQDFSISTPEELLESFGNILNIITAFLAGIAAISLIVGGVGIANTMYTSVIERTKEIGIMKAIGARNSDVLWIFLIEAGLLGLVGGIIGVVLGAGLSWTIAFVATQTLGTSLFQAAYPIWLIISCMMFGFLVGAVSGALPALQASKINVVDALRYE